MANRFGLLRSPASRSAPAAPHAPSGSAAGSAAGRGSVAGEIGAAVGEAAVGAAGGAAGAATGGASRNLLRVLAQVSGYLGKPILSALVAYELFKGLVGFKNDIVNGTPFRTGGAPGGDSPSSRAAAAPGDAVAVATPAADARIARSMSTVSGREALETSQRADRVLAGGTEARRLAYADGHAPVSGEPSAAVAAHREALSSNYNSAHVRMTVPADKGKRSTFRRGTRSTTARPSPSFAKPIPGCPASTGFPPRSRPDRRSLSGSLPISRARGGRRSPANTG